MAPPQDTCGAQQQQEELAGGAGGAGGAPGPGPALAHVLAAEGLPPRLREVVLYGVAMCDIDQEPTQDSQPQQQQQDQQQQQQEAAGGVGVQDLPLMSAAEGCAALQLLVRSQGRFGSPTAFMLPSYGCGSVAEAFVRMCAVHGAVTVLRQPVQGLVVEQQEGEGGAGAGAGEGAGGKEEGRKGGEGSGGGGRVVGVVTAAGQLVRCGAVVMGSGTLRWVQRMGVLELPWICARLWVWRFENEKGRANLPESLPPLMLLRSSYSSYAATVGLSTAVRSCFYRRT